MAELLLDRSHASRASAAGADMPAAPVTEGLPDLVQWSEGMLLSPQHLQQNDLYWQEQMRYRLAQLAPDAWGLSMLKLDTNSLHEGKVRVLGLECLMPDGSPVVFPGSFTAALEIDIAKQLAQEPKGVRISLVMPARSAASTRRDASLRRYDLVQGTYAIDENTGVGTVPVDRLRPRISLWAGGGIPAQYVVCPLLDVTRNSVSRAVETSSYHPPMLQWQAADALGRLSLRRRLSIVSDALWSKLRELAGNRTDDGPDDSMAARAATESARRLAAVLPNFTLLCSRPQARPIEVYDSLAQVAGAMAGFGLNPIPPLLDPYQHGNCEPQFRRALDYVVRKLSYINTAYDFAEFEQNGGRFTRQLPADTAGEIVVELRLPEGRTAAQSDRIALERWLKDACIASEELLDDALRTRVSARPRMLGADEIARRGMRAGGVLFAIDNEPFDLEGKGRQSLLQPGRVLVIDGYAGGTGLQPAAILLYQPKRNAAGPSHAAQQGPGRA
jgi:type VI secretion system protein ImpJ